MRIISPWHDYYDCAQAHGQDRTLIYHRKEAVIEVGAYPFPVLKTHLRYDTRSFGVEHAAIGFCGEIFPAVTLTKINTRRWEAEAKKICFDLASVDAFVRDNYTPQQCEAFLHCNQFLRKTPWPWHMRHALFVNLFAEFEQARCRHAAIFEQHHCPLFVAPYKQVTAKAGSVYQIILNASLKEYEFIRVQDPYTAFQSIAMYLGAMAEPRKPIPPIDDATMVEIKGFDKFSFRKDPSKKKRK